MTFARKGMMVGFAFGALCVAGSMLLGTHMAHAQTSNPGSLGGVTQLKNPLRAQSIQEFLFQIIDIILVFAVPIIVIFMIFAGFKYVTAGGNEEKIRSATTALTWAIIGGVLILGAKILLDVIQNTVKALQ